MAFMTSLISSGADAFNNLFDVTIDTLTEISTIRCMGFTPPEGELKTYNVSYMGVSIPKFGAKIDLKREFTIEYREDVNYSLLTALTAWKKAVVDPTGEGNITFGALAEINSNRSGVYSTIKVVSYKPFPGNSIQNLDSEIALTWEFKNVICLESGVPKYTRTGGDKPLTMTAKFLFESYTLS